MRVTKLLSHSLLRLVRKDLFHFFSTMWYFNVQHSTAQHKTNITAKYIYNEIQHENNIYIAQLTAQHNDAALFHRSYDMEKMFATREIYDFSCSHRHSSSVTVYFLILLFQHFYHFVY